MGGIGILHHRRWRKFLGHNAIGEIVEILFRVPEDIEKEFEQRLAKLCLETGTEIVSMREDFLQRIADGEESSIEEIPSMAGYRIYSCTICEWQGELKITKKNKVCPACDSKVITYDEEKYGEKSEEQDRSEEPTEVHEGESPSP